MNKYYVYAHYNPIKKEIFYIGKGYGYRAYIKRGRTKHWHNIVNKYGYEVHIIASSLNEQDACKIEIENITKIGRLDKKLGTLINLTDGGEGSLGRKSPIKGKRLSKETVNKMSKAKLGKNVIRPIIQLDLNGNILNEFINIKAAKKETGIGHIGQVVSGKFKHAGGFLWEYKETIKSLTI